MAVAVEVNAAVELREELQRQREKGVPFREAWPRAKRLALAREVEPLEKRAWLMAWSDLEPVWRDAYTCSPRFPNIGALVH